MISLKKAAIYSVLYSVIATGTACKKSEDKKTGNTTQSGILYYSAADDLTMYNFKTREEKVVFSGGDHYKLSADGQKFAWYKNNFSDGSTTVQIHSMQNPADFIPISIPAILESTPGFVNGEELLGALARSADEPDTRTDLILFNYHKEIIGRIPHVKDFAFTPDGKDLIVSAEAVNNTGAAIGYALALVKDFRSASSQQSIQIREFADYTQLPEDITISPNSAMAAYTHMDHLYTIPLKQSSNPVQITTSRFKEADANWSPNGNYLVFVANIADNTDCGEIRVVLSQVAGPVPVPEDGFDNNPADPLQPTTNNGKVIHSCGSESINWYP